MHPIFIVVGVILGLNIVLSIIVGHSLLNKIVLSSLFGLVGLASWFFVFRFRFWVLHLVAILFLAGMPFIASSVLKPHQSARLRVLTASAKEIRSDSTLKGVHWQLQHSLLAIGSGGVAGKGYQNSTHTRGDFVPEEHTDYIFCVASEEHGFVGSMVVLILFFLFLWRMIYMAEHAKSKYAQVYGYGVAAIIFMHVFVNIGMALGLLPTIGIPLPFLSYGGSSMISFTMMVFVLQNHYSYRSNILS
jgi:rod shape determining protein RodA